MRIVNRAYLTTGSATLSGTGQVGGAAWLQGVAVNEWVTIPNSKLEGSAGVATPALGAGYGTVANRINAWSGVAMKQVGSEIYVPAGGGHEDYAGNEVSSMRLNASQPVWQLRRGYSSGIPTAASFGDPYFADGRPNSRHSYHAPMFVDALNKCFLFGCGFLWRNAATGRKVDAFDPSINDWDPAGTWTDVPSTQGGNSGAGLCIDPGTSDVYFINTGGAKLYRWSHTDGSWTALAGTFNSFPHPTQESLAFDTFRQQIFHFTTQGGVFKAGVFNISTGARTTISMNASAALTALTAISSQGCATVYAIDIDAFLFYSGRSGFEGQVYKITPNGTTTWDVSQVTTTGVTPAVAPAAGVQNRFKFVPELNGCFVMPSYTADLSFLRTS